MEKMVIPFVHLSAGYVSMETMDDNREKRVIDQAVALCRHISSSCYLIPVVDRYEMVWIINSRSIDRSQGRFSHIKKYVVA